VIFFRNKSKMDVSVTLIIFLS